MYANEGNTGVAPTAGTAATLGVIPVVETRVVAPVPVLGITELEVIPDVETKVEGMTKLSVVLTCVVVGRKYGEVDTVVGADTEGLGVASIECSAIVGNTCGKPTIVLEAPEEATTVDDPVGSETEVHGSLVILRDNSTPPSLVFKYVTSALSSFTSWSCFTLPSSSCSTFSLAADSWAINSYWHFSASFNFLTNELSLSVSPALWSRLTASSCSISLTSLTSHLICTCSMACIGLGWRPFLGLLPQPGAPILALLRLLLHVSAILQPVLGRIPFLPATPSALDTSHSLFQHTLGLT